MYYSQDFYTRSKIYENISARVSHRNTAVTGVLKAGWGRWRRLLGLCHCGWGNDKSPLKLAILRHHHDVGDNVTHVAIFPVCHEECKISLIPHALYKFTLVDGNLLCS